MGDQTDSATTPDDGAFNSTLLDGILHMIRYSNEVCKYLPLSDDVGAPMEKLAISLTSMVCAIPIRWGRYAGLLLAA